MYQIRLAARADGDALSGALIAKHLDSRDDATAEDRVLADELREQASRVAAADPHIDVLLRDTPGSHPDHAARSARLQQAATANLFLGLVLFDAGTEQDAAIDAALARLAATPRYDSGFRKKQRSLHDRFDANETLPDDEAADIAMDLTIDVSWIMPLLNACRAPVEAPRRESCRLIARTMSRGSDTLIERMFAASVLESSAPTMEQARAVRQLRRRLAWMNERGSAVISDREWEAGEPGRRYRAQQYSQGEMVAIERVLVDNGIALTPPPEWKDAMPALVER